MYKYDQEKDEIYSLERDFPCITKKREMSHEMLNCLREAMGLKKKKQPKYTIQVVPDFRGFLNEDLKSGRFFIDSVIENDKCQTRFTLAEINKLKQRDDIAIDWNKAKIELVNDDE